MKCSKEPLTRTNFLHKLPKRKYEYEIWNKGHREFV
jgi:hypothetical protein